MSFYRKVREADIIVNFVDKLLSKRQSSGDFQWFSGDFLYCFCWILKDFVFKFRGFSLSFLRSFWGLSFHWQRIFYKYLPLGKVFIKTLKYNKWISCNWLFRFVIICSQCLKDWNSQTIYMVTSSNIITCFVVREAIIRLISLIELTKLFIFD